ncbi:MAG: hypothetical protein AAF215_35255 [Cyanobacteria bacterium P01_A01_bin.123]
MPTDTRVAQILPILEAYAQQFGVPQGDAELEAVIGAVLSVGEGLEPWFDDAEVVIKQVKAAFDPGAVAGRLVDEAQRAIATRVYQWRRQQQKTIFGVLNAYVQTFPEAFNRTQLPPLVATLMPMMADWRLTRPEARSLLRRVIEDFSVATALRRVVKPEWIAIAEQLADYRRHFRLEGAVMSVVEAYRQKFSLETLTETLVETALTKVLAGKWDTDIAIDLAKEDTQLVIKQVMFKVQFLKASPKVDKSAAAIAAQINAEIERFKREEADHPGVDATQPTRLGDLEVGIDIHEA